LNELPPGLPLLGRRSEGADGIGTLI
jgi:hypothetical protein